MKALDKDQYKLRVIIKRNLIALTILLSFGFLLYACNDMQNPVADAGDTSIYSRQLQLSNDVNNPETTIIADYEVSYTGKSHDQVANQTTFYYKLKNPGVTPIANKFTLEILTCDDPYAISPQASDIDNNIITWNFAVVDIAEYSITYTGELPTGSVNASLKRGNLTETKSIPGPLCDTEIETYTISGYVYVEVNENNVKDNNELGIGNVTVEVLDGNGNDVIYSQRTSNDGSYEFTVIGGDDYTVHVPKNTDDENDFNEKLFDLWNLKKDPPSYDFNPVDEDKNDINFGFTPDIGKITKLFSGGNSELDTENYKYWRKQLLLAINSLRTPGRGNRHGEIPAMNEYNTELLVWLEEIEERFLLPNIFNFGINKLQTAYNILQTPAKTESQELCVELLTAELNILSDRGSGSPDLDRAIAAFGEFFAAEGNLCISSTILSSGNLLMSDSVTETIPFTMTSSATTSDGTTLLRAFNGGGGGVGSR